MSQRYLVRTPLSLPVDVFHHEAYLGRFLTRDIDVEGVFLEMPTGTLKPNDVLELSFLRPDGKRCSYVLFACVARVTDEGAGLMLFDRPDVTLEILDSVTQRDMAAAS